MQTYHIVIDSNKKETTSHGSFEFPLAIYTTQISKNVLGFIDWHWHEELQFCLVTKGTVRFNVSGEEILLKEDEGLFINKDQLHKAENNEGADSSYICFDFHSNMISSFLGSTINQKYILPHIEASGVSYIVLKASQGWQLDILKMLREVFVLFDTTPDQYEFKIQIHLLQIWSALLTHEFSLNLKQKNFNVEYTQLKQALDYIHTHYMDKLELDQLSKCMNLSKSAFCRKFKHQMHCTVFDYIINYRISMAAEMLMKSESTITEIAYQCGFGSTSYFIEKFKEKTNASPLKYRKQHG